MLKHRIFFRRVDRVLGKEAHQELIDFLTGNTLAGDGTPGTGGMCKILIATSGRGYRIHTSFFGLSLPFAWRCDSLAMVIELKQEIDKWNRRYHPLGIIDWIRPTDLSMTVW